MKKIIAIGLLLLTAACNMPATPVPTAESTPSQTPPPTPIPTSPTPDIPTAAVASPTPEPPPYYFTDEFDTGSPYWEILQTGGLGEPTFAYENSALRIDISSPDTWSVGIHNAHSYPNVFIHARASASPSGSVGLICRYDESKGWFEYNISSDGTYNALYGQWLAPGIAKYIPIIADRSGQLSAGSLNYEIGLSCQDNFIFLYVNDALIRRLDVTNFGLVEGKIGITASSLNESPITALFEWVRVGME
jgi:hypothetical protein